MSDTSITPAILTLDQQQHLSDSITKDMFVSKPSNSTAQVLSRPSLSYWQDAFRRFKKNKIAVGAFFVVVAQMAFSIFGPWVYHVDPSAQSSAQLSVPPTLGAKAIVIEETMDEWAVPDSTEVPAVPAENISTLGQVSNLKVIGNPTTLSIKLQWDALVGASGYTIYRNEVKPEGSNYGIPMGDIAAGNKVYFEDRSDLKDADFYYTVVAKNLSSEESSQGNQIKVHPLLAVTLAQITETHPTAKVGDTIKLQAYPFGTDNLGRDLLSRAMYGGRVSLLIGFIVPIIYIFFGVIIGGTAGYIGGTVDTVIISISNFVLGLPYLLFVILLQVAFGGGAGESGIIAMIIAMVVTSWPGTAFLVRGQVFQLRESDFVQAAKLLGAKPSYLLFRHLVPNLVGVLLVSFSIGIPGAIFAEAFLSFIGIGVAPPTASWGSLTNDGIQRLLSHPHEFFVPASLIVVAVLAFNLLGDGMRDALDPRMRSTE